jgi:hypothetical protein
LLDRREGFGTFSAGELARSLIAVADDHCSF